MWGQGIVADIQLRPPGIIPMRVGTRNGGISSPLWHQDHPHACGDKMLTKSPVKPAPGSSPCVWGQAPFGTLLSLLQRIIPMRVGTSLMLRTDAKSFQDHPHACGDKGAFSSLLTSTRGSSPCVWGQATFAVRINSFTRIIPMRVGTRSTMTWSFSRLKDHPHACGDKKV